MVRHRTWRLDTAGTQCVVVSILTTGLELTFEDKIILKILFLIGPSLSRYSAVGVSATQWGIKCGVEALVTCSGQTLEPHLLLKTEWESECVKMYLCLCFFPKGKRRWNVTAETN